MLPCIWISKEIVCQKLSSCVRKRTKSGHNNSWKCPLKAQIPFSHPKWVLRSKGELHALWTDVM